MEVVKKLELVTSVKKDQFGNYDMSKNRLYQWIFQKKFQMRGWCIIRNSPMWGDELVSFVRGPSFLLLWTDYMPYFGNAIKSLIL